MTLLMKKEKKFIWSEDCEKAFRELKDKLTFAPDLTLPDETKGFEIYSDASNKGLSYVLMQNCKVIAYASC